MKRFLIFALITVSCSAPDNKNSASGEDNFYFGADLSYVNQILDHGGVYKVNNRILSPFKIFADHGNDIVRLRLWHTPSWTKNVYGSTGERMYNNLHDVEKASRLSKENGMKVLLDFHYSDTWADPGKQEIPAAWKELRSIEVLADSVYRYTCRTLEYLNRKGLMPEFIQIGNETNCGILYTNASPAFPSCNVCKGEWENTGRIFNAAIKAIREVSALSSVRSKIILHVADPENIDWWFTGITEKAHVNDFEIIGFSFYPLWHTKVPVNELGKRVAGFKEKFKKDLMILETAYPWTTENADSYNNIFRSMEPVPGYPFTPEGQISMMKAIRDQMVKGGGSGMICWEPAWITSGVKDLWGEGSAWENCTFFDYTGNLTNAIRFMEDPH